MSGGIIEFAAVSKYFGDAAVLSDISLSIAAGERAVICGPSGAGKSTLIRCVNGLEQHQHGTIRVGGETWYSKASTYSPI